MNFCIEPTRIDSRSPRARVDGDGTRRSRSATWLTALLLILATLSMTAAPFAPASANHHTRDTLELEEPSSGYTSEYMFAMSKGVMRSTLNPALKPATMLFTVPLDLVLLPFSAIAGFFR